MNNLKTSIEKKTTTFDSTRELTRFFTLIDARWSLWYYLPAFGLELLYFHFQLSESTSLKDIIDFRNQANTSLRASRVYRVRDFPKTYTGILVIPTELDGQLEAYLRDCERQGQIIIHELKPIVNARRSTSLTYYQEDKGWKTFYPTIRQRLAEKLKTPTPRKWRTKSPLLFITPLINTTWIYHRWNNPSEVITLLCKFAGSHSFNKLPLGSKGENESKSLSTNERSLLKELIKQRVVSVIFLANRLRLEFSLDEYWIRTPLVPLKQLSRLLDWLPYSLIYFTETNIFIQTVLDPNLVQMLKNDLKWVVIPIIEEHTSLNPKLTWFEPKRKRWKCPEILK